MRSPRRRFPLVAALLLGALAASLPREAAAQSPDEITIARQTAVDGLQAYQAGEFAKALGLFDQAKAIYPSAQILRMVGYSQLALERWMDAAASMDAALVSTIGPLSDTDKLGVEADLAKAMAHIGVLTIKSDAAGAQVAVDGGPLQPLPLERPLRLLEGKHTFMVTAPEHEDLTREILVEGGSKLELPLNPTPIPKDEPAPKPKPKVVAPVRPEPATAWFPGQRVIGFAAVGAGIALGAATLGTALAGARLRGNVESDVEAHNTNFGPNCDYGGSRLCKFDRAVINQDADRADTLRDASIGLGIGAGVLAAAGVVFVVFAPGGPFGASEEGSAQKPTAARAAPPAPVACGLLAGGIQCAGAF